MFSHESNWPSFYRKKRTIHKNAWHIHNFYLKYYCIHLWFSINYLAHISFRNNIKEIVRIKHFPS